MAVDSSHQYLPIVNLTHLIDDWKLAIGRLGAAVGTFDSAQIPANFED
jgi:hypothetical protein